LATVTGYANALVRQKVRHLTNYVIARRRVIQKNYTVPHCIKIQPGRYRADNVRTESGPVQHSPCPHELLLQISSYYHLTICTQFRPFLGSYSNFHIHIKYFTLCEEFLVLKSVRVQIG
jgi:hypothetical protein